MFASVTNNYNNLVVKTERRSELWPYGYIDREYAKYYTNNNSPVAREEASCCGAVRARVEDDTRQGFGMMSPPQRIVFRCFLLNESKRHDLAIPPQTRDLTAVACIMYYYGPR